MIRDKIFKESPYDLFDASKYSIDYIPFPEPPLFIRAVELFRPATIIEVGSWKGSSAILMAELCKKNNIPNPEIVCIDTWLGSHEMWERKEDREIDWGFNYKALNLVHGYPSFYYQFLANVVLSNHADCITPLPLSSVSAALFLKHLGVKADLIYIDGGHSYRDVKNDIESYWGLLRHGGCLLGDDYSPQLFPGVVQATEEFADMLGLRLQLFGVRWALVKGQS